MLKRKPLAAAVSLALLGVAAMPALAQDSADGATMQKVEVTGIRASMAKSLNVKRNSAANVEVVTAEDVGKMPDKNLADSLQRVPGVAVRTDYDEAEKVALRGTNPDMTMILFNGHAIAGADWYVGDQASASRSTSLSLLPSSVLNQAQIYKTSVANVVDGGLAGTINVTTRKPLAAKEKVSGVVSVGASYVTLPAKTAPDLDALVNWKNDANTFGFFVQGFANKRYIRRDSASRLAYGTSSGWDTINTKTMLGITDASLAGTGYKAADLDGVRMPGSMATEFVEGVRDRKGGMVSLQFKPNQDIDLSLTGFHSSMDTNNYGRLKAGAMYSMLLGKASLADGATGATVPNTNSNGQQVFASIRNPVIVNETTMYGDTLRVLKSADIMFPDGTTPQYIGNTEGFYRDGANATVAFLDLDGKWRVNQDLTLKTLVSTTRGVGKTEADQGLTYASFGTGTSYSLGDVGDAPYVKYYGTGIRPDELVGHTISSLKSVDKEHSAQIDAEYRLEKGWIQSIESGLRYSDHRRDTARRYPSYRTRAVSTNAVPASTIPWPSDFGADLNGPAGWDNTGYTFRPEDLKAYFAANTKETSDAFERRVGTELHVRERQSAAYLQANFERERLSGNLGLRFVQTRVNADVPTPIPPKTCERAAPGQPAIPCPAYPGAISTAGETISYYDSQTGNEKFNPLDGNMYYFTTTDRRFNNWLPSLNLRYELNAEKNMLLRFGASRTIGRQNYNIVGAGFGTPGCDAQGCKVTGPNPDLKPLTADNLDLSWSWYFANRSLAEVNLFHSRINGYPKTGSSGGTTIDLWDSATQSLKTYAVNTSSQQGARISGIELAYEQPFGTTGFGFTSNVSRAKTRVDDGRPMVGASEWAANLGGYFENDKLSLRLVANYRSEYVNSSTAPAPTANSQGMSTVAGILMPTAPTMAAPVTTLAFNASYNFTPNLTLAFDATNLTNVRRAYYRYSEEEQQKLDVIGRQFYLNLKYKF
jgi:iron complex outermembrane receptor protein